jgi:hypothetical protein
MLAAMFPLPCARAVYHPKGTIPCACMMYLWKSYVVPSACVRDARVCVCVCVIHTCMHAYIHIHTYIYIHALSLSLSLSFYVSLCLGLACALRIHGCARGSLGAAGDI